MIFKMLIHNEYGTEKTVYVYNSNGDRIAAQNKMKNTCGWNWWMISIEEVAEAPKGVELL